MTSQVQRFLDTEELYVRIMDLIDQNKLDAVGETHVRGLLDALLSLGKIEGRMTAMIEAGLTQENACRDQLIVSWVNIVESVS